MPPSRVDMLRSFIAQQPDQPFPRYALAQELKNSGDLVAATAEFASLMADHPDYVASYFHAGQTLVAQNRRDEAREVYTRGLQRCTEVGDLKTRNEIESALAELG